MEDIAVVGMACRVAGSNDTPEKLWQALMRAEVASGQIPSMRWEPYHRRDTRNANVRPLFNNIITRFKFESLTTIPDHCQYYPERLFPGQSRRLRQYFLRYLEQRSRLDGPSAEDNHRGCMGSS